MLPIPFALAQVASTSLLCAAPRPRNVVCSVPSRLGEHPGEATLLHGKAVSAKAAGETNVFCVLSRCVGAVDELTTVDCVLSFLSSSSESSSDIRSVGAETRFRLIAYTLSATQNART